MAFWKLKLPIDELLDSFVIYDIIIIAEVTVGTISGVT